MSSAGPSGMSDTERTNLPDEQTGPTGMPPDMSFAGSVRGPLMPTEDALEDPIEVIEMVTLDEETFNEEGAGGFRWWYVPVIGVPIAVGAGAAAWYFTKGRGPFVNAWELVTRPTRMLTKRQSLAARTRKATKKAMKTASASTGTLRGRMTGVLGAISAVELAEKAGDLWDDTRDSVTDLWDQVADSDIVGQARDTVENVRKSASRQLSGRTSRLPFVVRGRTRSRARRTMRRLTVNPRELMPRMDLSRVPWLAGRRPAPKVESLTARTGKQLAKLGAATATKTAFEATRARTARAARKRIKRVNSGIRRVQVFAFAMLVSAMVIYVRSWYARQRGTEMRETASGRLEPDTWPQFSEGSSGVTSAAPNVPGAPS